MQRPPEYTLCGVFQPNRLREYISLIVLAVDDQRFADHPVLASVDDRANGLRRGNVLHSDSVVVYVVVGHQAAIRLQTYLNLVTLALSLLL